MSLQIEHSEQTRPESTLNQLNTAMLVQYEKIALWHGLKPNTALSFVLVFHPRPHAIFSMLHLWQCFN